MVFWGIHAGEGGEADSLFLEKKVIAVGWSKFPDLSKYKTCDEIKKIYPQYDSETRKKAIGINSGQLHRFANEMQVGDYVIYPQKRTKHLIIGRITGDYHYSPNISEKYPHTREVEWVGRFSRYDFPIELQSSISSKLTLFNMEKYSEIFLRALAGEIKQAENIPEPEKEPLPDLNEILGKFREYLETDKAKEHLQYLNEREVKQTEDKK
jgi:restriction system protein